MNHLKTFETNKVKKGTPLEYRLIIRDIITELCKDMELNEYTEKIVNLIATNNTVYSNFGSNIKFDYSYKEQNRKYILDNFKGIIDTVVYTDMRGKLGELVVSNLLVDKFNLEVKESTKAEDIIGIDLITIGNKRVTHQVKTIYTYNDDGNTFKIYNRYLDIKPTDKYDYIWFLSTTLNEIIGFNHNNVEVIGTDYGYDIKYNTLDKIKKFNVEKSKIEYYEQKSKSRIYDMLSEPIKLIIL